MHGAAAYYRFWLALQLVFVTYNKLQRIHVLGFEVAIFALGD